MKTMYTINVKSENPEFPVDKEMQEMQVDGFLLLSVKDGKPYIESMQGMTIHQLTMFFLSDSDVCSDLREAGAISKGFREGVEIRMKAERKRKTKTLQGMMDEFMERMGLGEDECGK